MPVRPNKHNRLEEEIETLRRSSLAKRLTISQQTEQLKDLNAQLKTLQSQNDDYAQTIEAQRQQIDSQSLEVSKLANRIKNMEAAYERKQQEVKTYIDTTMTGLETENTELRDYIKELSEVNNENIAIIHKLNNVISGLGEENEHLKNSLQMLQDQIAESESLEFKCGKRPRSEQDGRSGGDVDEDEMSYTFVPRVCDDDALASMTQMFISLLPYVKDEKTSSHCTIDLIADDGRDVRYCFSVDVPTLVPCPAPRKKPACYPRSKVVDKVVHLARTRMPDKNLPLPQVDFEGDDRIREGAIDLGGPRVELFRLFFDQLKEFTLKKNESDDGTRLFETRNGFLFPKPLQPEGSHIGAIQVIPLSARTSLGETKETFLYGQGHQTVREDLNNMWDCYKEIGFFYNVALREMSPTKINVPLTRLHPLLFYAMCGVSLQETRNSSQTIASWIIQLDPEYKGTVDTLALSVDASDIIESLVAVKERADKFSTWDIPEPDILQQMINSRSGHKLEQERKKWMDNFVKTLIYYPVRGALRAMQNGFEQNNLHLYLRTLSWKRFESDYLYNDFQPVSRRCFMSSLRYENADPYFMKTMNEVFKRLSEETLTRLVAFCTSTRSINEATKITVIPARTSMFALTQRTKMSIYMRK